MLSEAIRTNPSALCIGCGNPGSGGSEMSGVTTLTFTVPLVPPSVNHYKMRTKKGVTFVGSEAKGYKDAVCLFARQQEVIADRYAVEVTVFQGNKDKGDVDNYAKCVLDGLVEAGVIYSDAAITDLTLRKRRDRENPRTEITVRAL